MSILAEIFLSYRAWTTLPVPLGVRFLNLGDLLCDSDSVFSSIAPRDVLLLQNHSLSSSFQTVPSLNLGLLLREKLSERGYFLP